MAWSLLPIRAARREMRRTPSQCSSNLFPPSTRLSGQVKLYLIQHLRHPSPPRILRHPLTTKPPVHPRVRQFLDHTPQIPHTRIGIPSPRNQPHMPPILVRVYLLHQRRRLSMRLILPPSKRGAQACRTPLARTDYHRFIRCDTWDLQKSRRERTSLAGNTDPRRLVRKRNRRRLCHQVILAMAMDLITHDIPMPLNLRSARTPSHNHPYHTTRTTPTHRGSMGRTSTEARKHNRATKVTRV